MIFFSHWKQGFGASKSKVSSYSSLFQRVLFLVDTLLHTYPFPPCYLFTFTLICLNFPFIYEKWVICFIWLLACIGETGRGRSVLQASWGDNLRQSKTQLWRRLLPRLALKHSFPFPSPNLYTSKIKQTNHSLFFIIANRSEIQTYESERNMCVNYYYYKD